MNIILEGPDNSGKSTLAKALSLATDLPIKTKEGRPATRLALFEKLRKYEAIDNHIVDRHPIISQMIYGLARGDDEIPEEFFENFFSRRDLIIYCRCIDRGLEGHEPSDTDTPTHLSMIDSQYQTILGYYDNWAACSANIIYHKYADMMHVVRMAQAVLAMEGKL